MLRSASFRPVVILIALAVALVAYTGSDTGPAPAGPVGNAERGKVLFSQTIIRSTTGCVACHSLEQDKVVVGPSLAGIATRAAKIIKSPSYEGTATTAETFLRESITRPNAAVETGFSHNIMPDWLTVLERHEIEDLVAFLASLR